MMRDAAEILFAVVVDGALGGRFGVDLGVAVGVGAGLATWGYANLSSRMRSRGRAAVSFPVTDAQVVEEHWEDFESVDAEEEALAFATGSLLVPFGARLVDTVESNRAHRHEPRRRRSDDREPPLRSARRVRRHRGGMRR